MAPTWGKSDQILSPGRSGPGPCRGPKPGQAASRVVGPDVLEKVSRLSSHGAGPGQERPQKVRDGREGLQLDLALVAA
eukprot:766178-Hanusia_phi.AAC.1